MWALWDQGSMFPLFSAVLPASRSTLGSQEVLRCRGWWDVQPRFPTPPSGPSAGGWWLTAESHSGNCPKESWAAQDFVPFPEVQRTNALASRWDNPEGLSRLQFPVGLTEALLWLHHRLALPSLQSYILPCSQVLFPKAPVNKLPIWNSASWGTWPKTLMNE